MGFEYHIQYEHNIWNYIFYLYYLLNKNPTEYNGVESYIYNQIQTEEINWVPILKADSLKECIDYKDKNEYYYIKINKLLSIINELNLDN